MTQAKTVKKPKTSMVKRIVTVLLIALCVVLAAVSVAGYAVRTTDSTQEKLNRMRTSAVIQAASAGLVDNIAMQANAAMLKELRALPDFRSMGMDEVKSRCAEAESAARAEAEALYGNTQGLDTSSLEGRIDQLESVLKGYNRQEQAEKDAYADMYIDLFEAVPDWTDLAQDKDDEALFAALIERVPDLGKEENAYQKDAFVSLARKQADAEAAQEEKELYEQLLSGVTAEVTDWEKLMEADTDDEALWAELTGILPRLADNEGFRDALLADVRAQAEKAALGQTTEAETEEEVAQEEPEIVVNQSFFTPTEALTAMKADTDAAYEGVWTELVNAIPDLDGLDKKMKQSIRENIEEVASSKALDFSEQYEVYVKQGADKELKGSERTWIRLAANAETFLIAAFALILLTVTFVFWSPLTRSMGIPRTIILLFFIYLLLIARLFRINVPLMMGDVLERVCMYGILALAMLPGIQCGIGLNMGMTLGCIAGLLATIMSLQFNMTGADALIFSCLVGALIAVPLGWAYSLLLNRMKGNEMTIATYVGFSFVSLMCIGWMLLPFNNTKIIWLLRGRGLRVTHSLLGSFGHMLDEFLSFDVMGIHVPTGGLLFFLIFCAVMWLFSRSKMGISMTAAGSNPRFAQASGINVDRMRSLGTVLSTVLAAVGIVIYSQAFGYAQLYTAPRQLGFLAASAILIGGATVSKAKVSHVIIGVFLFEGVLAVGQQIANAAFSGGGLSEVMRIMISNGIILYALTQSGGASRD